ncbi:MAG TPA: DUF3617 family protein [Pseudolabrys sp.]|nr:DUF3617 family protein [Pseudolabrys sp.]
MFHDSFRALALIVAVGSMAALPARAASQLEPGLWQDTETGWDNGKPTRPEGNTTCLSPDEARDPIRTILKDTEGQKCDVRNVKENGSTVTVELKCGDPKEMRMEIDMTINFISTRHYSGTMKSLVIYRGQKSVSQATIDSVWTATACKE